MIFGHIGGGSSSGYEIEKSLRLRASASAYLSKIVGAGGQPNQSGLSFHLKRCTLGVAQVITYATLDANNLFGIQFTPGDQLEVFSFIAGAYNVRKISTDVFRDPSSHYHIFLKVDTTLGVAEDRFQLFVNGRRITNWTTNTNTIAQNNGILYGGPFQHYFGKFNSVYFDGYISEINYVWTVSPDVSDFGEFSAETGQWIPKKYTGTYGANGFYLDFKDGSSLANLTADKSGNGNNWTANNISLTAGVNYDWMEDVPGNSFATLNPLHTGRSTLTSGNLTASGATDLPTILPSSATWYFERGGVAQTWTPPAAFPAGAGSCNFGQQPWQDVGPSSGQKALCQANLPADGTVTVSGTFTGNAAVDGPFVWMNGSPNTLSINGNAVTFGTHADRLANGFKVRTNSASYNAAGSNTWVATISSDLQNIFKYNNAKDNS